MTIALLIAAAMSALLIKPWARDVTIEERSRLVKLSSRMVKGIINNLQHCMVRLSFGGSHVP